MRARRSAKSATCCVRSSDCIARPKEISPDGDRPRRDRRQGPRSDDSPSTRRHWASGKSTGRSSQIKAWKRSVRGRRRRSSSFYAARRRFADRAVSRRRADKLHHTAYRVADIEAALAELKARGVRLIDERPRRGAHGNSHRILTPESDGRRAHRTLSASPRTIRIAKRAFDLR